MSIFIQWDSSKNRKNIEKHGVAFDEAATVFVDEKAVELYDEVHSKTEDRFWIIGKSFGNRVLLLVYSFRKGQNGKEIYYRIISARTANKEEREIYRSQS